MGNSVDIFFVRKKEGIPITEANYYAHITENELRNILRSDTSVEIPMFEARLKVLRESGKILLEVLFDFWINSYLILKFCCCWCLFERNFKEVF